MFFTTAEIERMDEKLLRDFLKLRVVERSKLDYKQHIIEIGKDDLDLKAKRNFLKDITGFANANGGNLIIGVKEPARDIPVDEQLVGIDNPKNMAAKLEALLRTGVDPRIYGVQVVPVMTGTTKGAIVVHVPPSQGRPHMVTLDGDNKFYIRHSESTVLMTSHEIKESILLTASSEGRAKIYFDEQRIAVAELLKGRGPYLHLQAMPLIRPEQPLQLFKKEIKDVLRGELRRNKYRSEPFSSDVMPRPTIDGMEGMDSRDEPMWISEIHGNGYISCWLLNEKRDYNNESVASLSYVHENAFMAFCELCRETLEALKFDVPYILKCTQHHAGQVYLHYKSSSKFREYDFEKPRARNVLRWPDQVRQVGEPFDVIAKRLNIIMHHAYGVEMYES